MQILPKIRTKYGEQIGVEILVQHPDIGENESTFIITDASAGASSFSADNGLKFAVGEYAVVGNFGAEKTEIIRIHASSAPSAGTITLNAITNFAHNRGDRFQTIPYNQIVIQRSTDSGSTYSDLATIDIRADAGETYYNHTSGASTDYYRAKFSNSATTNVSQNSDGIIATGYAEGTVGMILRDALISLGEKIDNEVLTKEFLLRALDEGRDEIDLDVRVKRWSFRTVFEYDAGDVIPGKFQLTLPTDIRGDNTFENVLSLRIGRNKYEVFKIDKRALNKWYEGVAHTTLNGAVLAADTSITLTSSGDFDESGAVDIAAEAVTGTIDVVDYTANNESTNVISGVTNIVSGGHSTAIDVWQSASFGLPVEFTVFESKITFSQPFSDDLAGENIWLDYYKKKTVLNSEADTFDEPFYAIYRPYIRYRVKLRKNPQMIREQDDDYKKWAELKEAQIMKEYSPQHLRLNVDVPC